MIFRKVSINDVEDCRRLISDFHKEFLNDFGLEMRDFLFDKLKESHVFQTTWVAIDPKKGCVGIFAGYKTTYVINDEPLFHELCWFVEPSYRNLNIGKNFYRFVEDALRDLGIKKIIMIHMATKRADSLGALYRMLGYKPLETHYIKDLEDVCQTTQAR